jgi:hypothetical protein
MPNTPNREVKIKQRKTKERWKRKRIASLANAKKKTLEALYKKGSLPKVLFSKIGL